MLKNKIATLAVTAALGLSVGLVGCTGTDSGSVSTDDNATTTTSTSKGIKDLFATSGYQGKLDGGMSIIYMQIGGDDADILISLTDATHEGEDAIVYAGPETKDGSGKSTVTDKETGKSISCTLTDNGDGTATIDVDEYGKGELTTYEGDLFSVVSSMAEADAAAKEESSSPSK